MRYRIVVLGMRHTPEYRKLSGPGPNARTLLEWLIHGDPTSIIPGLFCTGWRALMEQLGWDEEPDEVQRRVWEEVLASGLVRYDPKTRLVWLPDLVAAEYLPDQPNVLKSWAGPWAELPDCDLKHQAWEAFRRAFYARQPKRIDHRQDPAADRDKPATVYGPMFDALCPQPRCPRSEAQRQHANEPRFEPQSEARSESQVGASAEGSPVPSGRGSLSGTGSGRRTEPGSEDLPDRAPAPPPARGPATPQVGVFANFVRIAGGSLGVLKPNLSGALGMPKIQADKFLEAWRSARDGEDGWTEADLLATAEWMAAGGLRWIQSRPYQYLSTNLIQALESAKEWVQQGKPQLDSKGRPIAVKDTSRPHVSEGAAKALGSM